MIRTTMIRDKDKEFQKDKVMRQEQSGQAKLQRPQGQASIYCFTCTLIIILNSTLGEIEDKEK